MVASATAAYVWEDPGDSIMVQITLDVVGRLGEAVQQSLGAGPRGEEIGGILLGRSLPGAGRTVQIEDFELVPCQHLRGASYTLAPRDRESLSAQLARRKAGTVVGYFRSHTRPGLYLDQDDFAIISRYFSDPSDVALVVRPSAEGPAVGGFFFWEEGDINRRAPYREFPFDREQLLAGSFSISDKLTVAAADLPSSAPIMRPAAAIRFRLPHVPWLAVPIIAGLVLLAGLFVSQKDTPKSVPTPVRAVAQPQSRVVLKLEAEKAGEALQLRWDPNAPAIQKADMGVLWITDGAQRQRRELSQQELAAGSTLYTPASANVNFELQVFTLTDRTNKSVQWVAGEAPPAAVEVAQTIPAQQPAQQEAPAQPQALAAPLTPAVTAVDRTAAKPRTKRPLPKRMDAPAPAPVATAHMSPVDVPSPPSLVPSERSQPKLVAMLPPRPVTLPAAPEATVSFEPAHGSAFKRVLHKISTLGEGETVDGMVPPAPVHQVSPAIPSGSEGSVDVKVYIDESGNVSRAQLLTKKNELAGVSLGAARQWRFTPARKHDKPVASEMVLHFRFGGA